MGCSSSALSHSRFDHSWTTVSSTVQRPTNAIGLVCDPLFRHDPIVQHNYSVLSLHRPFCSQPLLGSIHHLRNCSSTIDDTSWTIVHSTASSTTERTQTTAHQSTSSCFALFAAPNHLSALWLYRCFKSFVVVPVGLLHLIYPIGSGLCRVCRSFRLVQETIPRVSQTLATTNPSIIRQRNAWVKHVCQCSASFFFFIFKRSFSI